MAATTGRSHTATATFPTFPLAWTADVSIATVEEAPDDPLRVPVPTRVQVAERDREGIQRQNPADDAEHQRSSASH